MSWGQTYRQRLTQVISWLIVIRRMNVPAPCLISIYTHKVSLPHIVCEIVLGYIASIRKLERFVLDLRSIGIKGKIWQLLILVRIVAIGETIGIEAPQCPKDGDIGQCFVDKVLVGTSQVGIDYPMQVAKG